MKSLFCRGIHLAAPSGESSGSVFSPTAMKIKREPTRLQKKAKRGHRGYPLATVAYPAFLTALLLRRPIAACLLRCAAISLLDIVSTMPSSRNGRAPRIQATLDRLAT